jgi:hypothetical protein
MTFSMGNLSPLKCQYEYEETLNLILGLSSGAAGANGTEGAAEASAAAEIKLRLFIGLRFSLLTYTILDVSVCT